MYINGCKLWGEGLTRYCTASEKKHLQFMSGGPRSASRVNAAQFLTRLPLCLWIISQILISILKILILDSASYFVTKNSQPSKRQNPFWLCRQLFQGVPCRQHPQFLILSIIVKIEFCRQFLQRVPCQWQLEWTHRLLRLHVQGGKTN